MVAMNEIQLPCGFNSLTRTSTTHCDVRVDELVGSPTQSQPCPYESLPMVAQKAFLQLKRNTGAPDAAIFAWLLTAMAAAAMRKARVKPPGRDEDILSLTCITATEPGTGKSPVYKRVIPPFLEYDIASSAKRQQIANEHEPDMESWKAKRKGLSELLTKLTKSTKPEDADRAKEVENRLKEHVRQKPTKPRPRRMLKTSASFIRILQAMDGDSESMLLATDDGTKLLTEIIKDDPDHFNRLFDGSTIVYERNNQDLVITNPLVTFGINTHPKTLMAFLKKNGDEIIGNGLLPRCLLSIDLDEGKEEDETVNDHQWHDVDAFNYLIAGHLRDPDNTVGGNPFKPKIYKFDLEATESFNGAKTQLKAFRQTNGELHGVKSFARKAPQLIARIAAIFALFDKEESSHVTGKVVAMATTVVAWYLLQAKEILINRPLREKMKILLKCLETCFRDQHHFKYAKIKNRAWIPKTYLERFLHMEVDVLNPLLAILEVHGIVKVQPHRTGMTYVQLNDRYFYDHH